MTQQQDKIIHGNGAGTMGLPNPEVLPKAKRRTFTAGYKSWVLEKQVMLLADWLPYKIPMCVILKSTNPRP